MMCAEITKYTSLLSYIHKYALFFHKCKPAQCDSIQRLDLMFNATQKNSLHNWIIIIIVDVVLRLLG